MRIVHFGNASLLRERRKELRLPVPLQIGAISVGLKTARSIKFWPRCRRRLRRRIWFALNSKWPTKQTWLEPPDCLPREMARGPLPVRGRVILGSTPAPATLKTMRSSLAGAIGSTRPHLPPKFKPKPRPERKLRLKLSPSSGPQRRWLGCSNSVLILGRNQTRKWHEGLGTGPGRRFKLNNWRRMQRQGPWPTRKKSTSDNRPRKTPLVKKFKTPSPKPSIANCRTTSRRIWITAGTRVRTH